MKEALTQKIFVRMDPALVDLPIKEKVKLIDSIGASAGSKALIVDLDFSHTGRRINRRVYSRAGHLTVPEDLTRPYPKPITIDHADGVKSIIGRVVEASYTDTIDEAKAYFKKRRLSDSSLIQIVEGLTDLDYQKAAAGFHKTKILSDKNWKGIGKVTAKARITDGEAIVKFFDQRYLTFSAEQDTDEYVCSICFQDWYKDGFCGHEPGSIVDGKLAFTMTGKMKGHGTSVVTHPADPDSIVTGLSLSDSEDDNPIEIYNRIIDTYIVDGKSTIVDTLKEEANMNDLLKKLLSGEVLTSEEGMNLYNSIFSQDSIKEKKIIVDEKEVNISSQLLNSDDLVALPDSVFVGGRTGFPIPDNAHAIVFDEALKSEVFEIKDELKNLIDLKLKALGIDSKELETEISDLKAKDSDLYESLIKNISNFTDKLSDEDFKQKLWPAIEAKVLSLDLIKKPEDLTDKVTSLESEKNSLTLKVQEVTSDSIKHKERASALAVQYRELLSDHRELAKNLGKKAEETRELMDKLVPVLSILNSSINISDKNIKNINTLLDSVDVKTLESKINNGLQRDQVLEETNPAVESSNFNDTDTSPYEKKVAEKYKHLKDNFGEANAKAYFNKVKQYCKKDFNPSSMEK